MTLERFSIAALSLCVLFAGAAARAESPAGGSFTIGFDGADSVLTFPSLHAEFDQCDPEIPTDCIEFFTDLATNIDAKGKVSGDGGTQFSFEVGGETLSGLLLGTITGSLKRTAQGTQISLKYKFTGTVDGDLQGQVFDDALASMNGSVKGFVGESGDLIVDQKFNLKIQVPGAGTLSLIIPLTGTVEAGPSFGAWQLQLDVEDAGGGKLGGSATATLSDGLPYAFEISGKYNANKDNSTLSLKPADKPSLSIKLQKLDVFAGEIVGGEVIYSAVGQSGRRVLAP